MSETILEDGSHIRSSGTTETVDPRDYHRIDFYAGQGELSPAPDGIYTNTIVFELSCSG